MKKLMILLVLAALVPAGCGAPAADVAPQQILPSALPVQEKLTYQVDTRTLSTVANSPSPPTRRAPRRASSGWQTPT